MAAGSLPVPRIVAVRRRAGALACAFGLLSAPAATAQNAAEVCVECSGPVAVYRCVVAEAARVQQFRAANKALQFVCASELARHGGHEKCRARRESQAGQCLGEERIVGLSGVERPAGEKASTPQPQQPAPSKVPAAQAPVPQIPPAQTAAPPAQPPPHPPSAPPPRTVAEMAERAGESSKEGLKKAGGAVKNAWTCLTSFFSDC
jgi:hypothetical protein